MEEEMKTMVEKEVAAPAVETTTIVENDEPEVTEPVRNLYRYTFILKGKKTWTTDAETEEEAKQRFEEDIMINSNPIIDIIENEMPEPEPVDLGYREMKSTKVIVEKGEEYLKDKKAEFAKMFAEASKQKIDGATDNVATEVVEKKTTKKKKSA